MSSGSPGRWRHRIPLSGQRDLVSFGPLIDVTWSMRGPDAAARRAARRPVTMPIAGVGLIDTGSAYTLISGRVAQALDLPDHGTAVMISAQNEAPAPIYRAELVIHVHDPDRGRAALRLRRKIEFPGAGESMERVQTSERGPLIALLGRDVLEGALFEYDGPGNGWEVTFVESAFVVRPIP